MNPSNLNLRIRSRLDKARRHYRVREALSLVLPGYREWGPFFGARAHRFQLSPPLPSQTVEQWEREFGVVLPESYRSFITEIGDSGAGPDYGLRSLQFDLTLDDEDRQYFQAHYQAPCPLREDMPLGGEDEKAWLKAIGGPEWQARFLADEWSPYKGTISLGHAGCAWEYVLILNGPLRGRMCLLNETEQPTLSDAPDFLGWYEEWLDAVLAWWL